MEKNQVKFTVSIGIPAYNEEANIGYLLKDLLVQKEEGYTLEKIYVYSDGSTDATESIVSSAQDERVELIVGAGRKGCSQGQNTIMEMTQSDCLVLLDADIRINSTEFISRLVLPIFKKQADLSSASVIPLPARGFFESILVTSTLLKNILFESYKNGNNVYTCSGRARALSQRFYKQFKFPKSAGEDAHSFLACISRVYVYQYVRGAVLYYRLPSNFADHKKQSTRFFKSKNNFGSVFGESFVYRNMKIPGAVYLRAFIKALPLILRNPVMVGVYLFFVVFLRIQAFFGRVVSETWEISVSSKNLQ